MKRVKISIDISNSVVTEMRDGVLIFADNISQEDIDKHIKCYSKILVANIISTAHTKTNSEIVGDNKVESFEFYLSIGYPLYAKKEVKTFTFQKNESDDDIESYLGDKLVDWVEETLEVVTNIVSIDFIGNDDFIHESKIIK